MSCMLLTIVDVLDFLEKNEFPETAYVSRRDGESSSPPEPKRRIMVVTMTALLQTMRETAFFGEGGLDLEQSGVCGIDD